MYVCIYIYIIICYIYICILPIQKMPKTFPLLWPFRRFFYQLPNPRWQRQSLDSTSQVSSNMVGKSPKIGRCLELIFCFAPAVIDMAIWVVSFSDTPMSRIIHLEAPRLYREHHVYKHMDVPANQFRWLPKGYVSAISHDFPKIGFTIWHRHEALSSSCKFDWLRSVYDHVSGSWMVMISGAMFIIRTYLSNYQVSTTWLQTSHLWIGRNENHLLSNVKVGDQVGSLQQVMSCVIQIAKTVPLQGFIT